MPHRLVMPRSFAWLASFVLLSYLSACDQSPVTNVERDVNVTGTLLDDDGEAWAGATVYVPADGADATQLAGHRVEAHRSNTGGCDTPGTPVIVWVCTDVDGRFALSFTSTATDFEVVARKDFRVLRVPFDVPTGVVPGAPATIDLGDRRLPDLDPVEDLRSAIRFALPGLHDFSLVAFPDEKVVFELENAMQATDGGARYIGVPLRDADGTLIPSFQLTVYHHDLRLPEAASCPGDLVAQQVGDTLGCTPVEGPSRTFQGVPVWSDDQFREAVLFEEEYRPLFVDPETEQLKEAQFQPSIVSLITEGPDGQGTSVAGFYFGPGLESPAGFQSLRSALETVIDPKLTERLVQAAGANAYVVFSLADYDVPEEHGGPPYRHPDDGLDATASTHDHHVVHTAHGVSLPGVQPLGHVGTIDGPRISRMVAQMVADVTIYDRRRSNPVVQAGWWSRADHAANVQDLAFTWLQIYDDAPAGLTTLDQWSNAFILRTRIGRYWALTEASAQALDFNDESCANAPSLIDEYRQRSPNAFRDDELEFWGWWTNTRRYATFNAQGQLERTGPLGCAWIGTLGETGRDRNVSWTHLSFQTLDNTAATFAHETGHLLDGTHTTTATIRRSHRCNLLGFIPVGPTGPSLHHWRIEGTVRTLCFARTEDGDTSKRNMTRVAEYLHELLPGVP